jgi:copper chaperone CopZ
MMKVQTVKFKQVDMLCEKCVLNVVKALSHIEGIQELEINLEERRVKITYDNNKFSRQKILYMINESIIKGEIKLEVIQ